MTPQQTLRRAARAAALIPLAAACGCAPAGNRQNVSQQGVAGVAQQQNAAAPRPSVPAERPSPAEVAAHALPRPAGHVNDFAKVIDEPARLRLEDRLRRLKDETGVEFAVLTIDTTGGRDISDYSLEVARDWGIGPPPGAPRGGGLLLVVAAGDRNWRVQVSRHLKAALPNDAVKGIGDRVAPHFRRGDFGRGISDCAEQLIARLSARPEPTR
jgi:uncharacterized membrane protein YgcG